MQWNKSSLMLMSLLYSLREAQVFDEMPRGCRSHYSLSGLPRIPEEVLLGLRVWDPEGSTAISVQHTKRRIFKILNIQIHRIYVFAILYFVYFTNII